MQSPRGAKNPRKSFRFFKKLLSKPVFSNTIIPQNKNIQPIFSLFFRDKEKGFK